MAEELLQETTDKVTNCNQNARPEVEQVSPDELLARLKERILQTRPDADFTRVDAAYKLARDAHQGQLRRSGEPYIIHPLAVAIILAELEMDQDSLIAGILHDVVEDTAVSLDEVREKFGDEVAELVDGVTKLTRLNWEGGKEEQQAENLRKMFLAMAKDIRVIIIKLADRTHNMRTLQYMTPEKQREKATETLDIYAPLADRMGISRLKVELDNLSLSYLEPEVYKQLVADIDRRKMAREDYIEGIVDEITAAVTKADISCEVYGRVKHYFSIYKKMTAQGKTLDEIYDLFAVRVLVKSVPDCYAALGIIHEMYTPVPGRFKDYIAMPKPNRYQSLHTTLIGRDGQPFEVQIRTYEMHKVAEYGIAAHWKYKTGSTSGINTEEEKLSWLRQILEWQQDMPDDAEFLDSLKMDLNLFSDSVYCFTPAGDVKELPVGSTPVDFAYMVHSAVGNKMIGAKVNDKLVPIDYQLHSGDRVEIITSGNSKGPSRDWLKFVASAQARNKINQWFRSQSKEDNIARGKELLTAYCKVKSIDVNDLFKPEYTEAVQRKYGFRDWDSVVAAVGHGGLKEGQVVNRLVEERKKYVREKHTDADVLSAVAENRHFRPAKAQNGIIVEGLDDMSVRLSKCCNPIPGDEIVGFITRGRGISIHRTDCVNIINLPEIEKVRLIDAEWQSPEGGNDKYVAELRIYVYNRIGVLSDISRVLAEQGIDIVTLTSALSKQGMATITVSFETAGVDEISNVIGKLRQIESVVDIERNAG